MRTSLDKSLPSSSAFEPKPRKGKETYPNHSTNSNDNDQGCLGIENPLEFRRVNEDEGELKQPIGSEIVSYHLHGHND